MAMCTCRGGALGLQKKVLERVMAMGGALWVGGAMGGARLSYWLSYWLSAIGGALGGPSRKG